jgi:hypothetical protein
MHTSPSSNDPPPDDTAQQRRPRFETSNSKEPAMWLPSAEGPAVVLDWPDEGWLTAGVAQTTQA